MGPIPLNIASGRLQDDWEEACRSEVTDYKAQNEKEICINETYLKEPPNVLVFALNRVKYDTEQKKLVKDMKKFEFDEVIHID